MPKAPFGAPKVGVIGGSGLYALPELRDVREAAVRTPFGAPSDKLVFGTLGGVRAAFLPRHGRGHRLLPTEINHRANIHALKSAGVEQVISVAAVGSLKEELQPRDFVFPDQLVDETRHRTSTFFGGGIVAHAAFARPFCDGLSELLYRTSLDLGLASHRGGVYCCMEGPQFSTRAECETHRRLGYDLIGMTASPEAKLAREAELCYAPVSMVTDYDCWREEDEVDTAKVIGHLSANVQNVQRLVAAAIEAVGRRERACLCKDALKGAVFTDPKARDKRTLKRLALLLKSQAGAP